MQKKLVKLAYEQVLILVVIVILAVELVYFSLYFAELFYKKSIIITTKPISMYSFS